MKSAASGTASGCVVGTLVFCILSVCLLSVGLPLAGALATLNGEFMVNTMGPYLCPPGSTGEIVTHASTSTDSSGNRISATAYAMQCVDANGVIVREPSPDYIFIWVGVVAVIGLVVAALLAVLLAAPAGVLVGNLVGRSRRQRAR